MADSEMTLGALVTVPEAARYLGLSYQGAEYLVRAHKLPVAERVGNTRRYRRADIENLRFRRKMPARRELPAVVYRLFDAGGILLYVGITIDVASRWDAHSDKKPWWGLVASATFSHHPDIRAARLEEERAIAEENPRFNIKGIAV